MERQRYPCEFDGCSKQSTIHITWVDHRRANGPKNYCQQHVKELDYWNEVVVGKGRAASFAGARCFDMEAVYITENDPTQFIYLHEVGGERVISIAIGIFEATSIERNLQQYQSPRPLTHDAMYHTIAELGGKIENVVIDKLEGSTYFAKLRVRQTNHVREIDMRPSDAICMAIIADCPIFFTNNVIALVDLGLA